MTSPLYQLYSSSYYQQYKWRKLHDQPVTSRGAGWNFRDILLVGDSSGVAWVEGPIALPAIGISYILGTVVGKGILGGICGGVTDIIFNNPG
jgi:hypothetical protein